MRRVETIEPAHPVEQLVDHAMRHLDDLAVGLGMQAAEIRDHRRGPHAAQEAVALEQERARAAAGRGGRGGDPRRAAAQHDDVGFGDHRGAPRGFLDEGGHEGHQNVLANRAVGGTSRLVRPGGGVEGPALGAFGSDPAGGELRGGRQMVVQQALAQAGRLGRGRSQPSPGFLGGRDRRTPRRAVLPERVERRLPIME